MFEGQRVRVSNTVILGVIQVSGGGAQIRWVESNHETPEGYW